MEKQEQTKPVRGQNLLEWYEALISAALVLVVMSLSVPAAAAETITVNVTNTPVRGSVALEKTGLQLVRFTDEQDEWGNTVMKPVYQ